MLRTVLVILLCLLFLFPFCSKAQDTSAMQKGTPMTIPKDTLKRVPFQPDAKRSGLYSALIPGLGQLYNRQYWKVPIVYGLMGTTTYFAIKNNREYQRYRKAYISRIANGNSSNDEFQGVLSTEAIKSYQDEAKQNADMMVVYTVLGYAVQLLEAISGAHLKNFDISRDLALQIGPVVQPNATVGVGLVVHFKK